jgi:hypothetical protein
MSDSVLKTGVGVLVLIGIFVGGIVLGNWLGKPTIDDLIDQNRILYEQDSLKAVLLEDTTVAYNRIVLDVRNAKEMAEVLRDENEVLGAHNASQELRITSLLSFKARLEFELETALSNVSITDTLIKAEINAYQEYDSGSIQASGEVRIDPRNSTGEADLQFSAEINPVVTYGRDEAGLGSCLLTFGDMPIEVDRLHCVEDLTYEPPVRGNLFGSIPEVLITVGVAVVMFLVGLAI